MAKRCISFRNLVTKRRESRTTTTWPLHEAARGRARRDKGRHPLSGRSNAGRKHSGTSPVLRLAVKTKRSAPRAKDGERIRDTHIPNLVNVRDVVDRPLPRLRQQPFRERMQWFPHRTITCEVLNPPACIREILSHPANAKSAFAPNHPPLKEIRETHQSPNQLPSRP